MKKKRVTKEELISQQKKDDNFTIVKPRFINPLKQWDDLKDLELNEKLVWMFVTTAKITGITKSDFALRVMILSKNGKWKKVVRTSLYDIYKRACDKIERRRGR